MDDLMVGEESQADLQRFVWFYEFSKLLDATKHCGSVATGESRNCGNFVTHANDLMK